MTSASNGPSIPVWKQAGMQLAAGGSAGFIEICMMHPLDVVKTRFQVQNLAKGAASYTSVLDCLQKTIRSEGLLAIYKGIGPPILVETPKRACKFFTFEQYKKVFSFGAATPSAFGLMAAGACSGLTEAFIVNPFEVVKVRQQTNTAHVSKQLSAFATARQIIAEKGLGLNGLNKGLTSTLGRHGVWNMIYFGFYHNIKSFAPKADTKAMDYFWRILIGFSAGSIASTCNIPWDVAKSRIQSATTENTKYKSCIQTIMLVQKEEGTRALFKGLAPKLMRFGPGGAIMIIAYEEIYKILKGKMRLI